MPYRDSCSYVALQGATLYAECRTMGNVDKESYLDLDTLLDNIDGEFVWGYTGFSKTAWNIRLKPDGHTLTATLLRNSNANNPDGTVDLNLHIENNNGVLQGLNIPEVKKLE